MKAEELKSSELRIGNFLRAKKDYHNQFHGNGIVSSIEQTKFVILDHYPGKWFEPIPLTEEWLLKFGFEFHTNANCQNFYYAKDAFICIRADEDFEWFRYYNGDFYHELKYVHQLQNLYFALTGEELTLNP
jgi:hypothetical protein